MGLNTGIEHYYSNGVKKETFAYNSQTTDMYDVVREAFPWIKPEDYFSVSKPVFHEVLGEEVVTCCLPLTKSIALVGPQTALTARKFCMESKTSFLRSYELYPGERPAWLPESAQLYGYGINHPELGRPFPALASTFEDFYFAGDPDAMEAAFNLPRNRGAYETFYGATVVNGVPVRVKQYCYDEQNTFSDWDVGFMVLCKRLGRKDLLI